jgi:hypothetical protein
MNKSVISFFAFLFPLLLASNSFADQSIVDSMTGMDKFKPNDYDESLEVPWVEIETQVSKLPQEKNLKELQVDKLTSMPSGMRFSMDLENVTVSDKDYVTRTWFVVRSDTAYNGTYEGIRCATGEYKVYAYANPTRSKPLRIVKMPTWKKIRARTYRAEVARDYICDDVRPKSEHAVKQLRY